MVDAKRGASRRQDCGSKDWATRWTWWRVPRGNRQEDMIADVKRGLPGGHNRGFQDVQIVNVRYIKRITPLFVSLYLVSRGRVGGGVYREGGGEGGEKCC